MPGAEFFLTALIVVLIPGTGVVYTIATGLARGRLASIWAAFGCTLGIVPHILASVLGLAAILHTSAVLFQGLKYTGAAYLIYLAVQTLRERGPISFSGENKTRTGFDVVRTGFLINILNPKLSIFFLAFLPQFVSPGSQTALFEMLVLGGLFMGMTFAVFLVYGFFAAWAGKKVLGSVTIMSWMRRTTALVFAGLGARLALAER